MTTHVTPPAAPALDAPEVDSARGAATEDAGTVRAPARAALVVVMLVAASVFWLFDALPFQDLPAHAGLIAMRHRFPSSAFDQRYFVLAPHIGPYSVFRFLGEMFVRVIGPIPAVRALGTLPLVATPVALLFARKRLYADATPTYGYLGVALSFGIMTLLGFASYLLGVAVMLVGLTLWLDLLAAVDEGRDGRSLRIRELLMIAFAPLIFVAHGHAFLLFLLCAGISALSTGRRVLRLLRLLTLGPALALAAWVAWIEHGTTTPPGSVPQVANLDPQFHGIVDKLGLLVSPTLMTRTGVDLVVSLLLLAFTLASAAVTVRSLGQTASGGLAPRDVRHSRALYACAGVIAVVFVLLPHSVGWFGFVDGRLVPVALFLALLGIRRAALPRPVARGLLYGAPIAASTVTLLALVASYRFQDEARGFKEVLAHVRPESTLLNLPLDPNSDVFAAHPFIHYDKLALVDRPVVVSDVWFHQGSALYPTPANPALRLPESYSESNLKSVDWPAYHLEDWDYILIRTRPNAAQPYTPASLALVEHRGGWWLFHRAATAGGS